MRVSCSVCSKPFEAKMSNAKYCGGTCRQRAARGSPVPKIVPEIPQKTDIHPLVAETQRELSESGNLHTVLGQTALRLAEKLAESFDTGSAMASLSRELRAVMAEVKSGTASQGDSLDEIAQRRAKKAASA
jgi:hypothetical protein